MSDIINQLASIVSKSHPSALKRMRLAVSPKEYQEIKKYMIDTYGVFYERIMNVPLIVEEDPENPPLMRIL
jgi:hypothetical protein